MSTTNDKPGSDLDPMSLEAIEAQLEQFEREERKRLVHDRVKVLHG